MFRRISTLQSARRVCLPCLTLALICLISLPIFAAGPETVLQPDDGSAGVLLLTPDLAVSAPAAPDGIPVAGDEVLVALDTPKALEKLSDAISPRGALTIGQGRVLKVKRPDLSKTPGRLAAAGLLLVPLDSTLEKVIPRVPAGQKADGFTQAIDSLGGGPTLLGIIGGMYLLGDKDDKDTAKLALSALVNATITTEGVKILTGRERPDEYGGLLRFRGPTLSGDGTRSFPSGHTSAAFALATVLANKHPKQKWLYYGLATAVAWARVHKSAHFPSDVLVGAAIGINAGNNALRGGPRILSIKL